MSALRLRWILGISVFLLPTFSTLADRVFSLHLSGSWLYVELAAVVIICGGIALSAPFVWWRRLALLLGTLCLLVIQVLVLGAFALTTTGLEGIQ
jgi:hypothetical protein